MDVPFLGSEATAAGRLSPYELRSRFAAVYPNVYLPKGMEITAVTRAEAAWLWTRRQGVVAGQSAAALHGAEYVDASKPAELIHDNRHPPRGIRTWSYDLADDEIRTVGGIVVTTPARTALDLACGYPMDPAIEAIDALANATELKPADVELLAQRYPGRRGIRTARDVLALVDGGAESPRETRLRLLLIRAGYPPPTTQIPIFNEFGVLVAVADMGWEELKIAADYEGSHHRTPRHFNTDLRRHDEATDLGWIDVRVSSLDTEAVILHRMAKAWQRRGQEPPTVKPRRKYGR
ncbi:hypothetical protein H7J88_22560 [Mycolicibacterium flavescens]|uniref:Cullin, a subunit of E3 ubiquitin ligase n=1 Tax=Mycolicibacterium flavescens TaxID=1776 RepID=A0A1E3RDJ3_MYCFV|nr:hypothetical protein [Mycolicibacterium flavescens]MCV7282419.1 hypothetical protein [Mycolicibacterium flavescens]ODQ87938.1 hypothetical protein BHQ18_21800 [Mycolicibacterium flavescens]